MKIAPELPGLGFASNIFPYDAEIAHDSENLQSIRSKAFESITAEKIPRTFMQSATEGLKILFEEQQVGLPPLQGNGTSCFRPNTSKGNHMIVGRHPTRA